MITLHQTKQKREPFIPDLLKIEATGGAAATTGRSGPCLAMDVSKWEISPPKICPCQGSEKFYLGPKRVKLCKRISSQADMIARAHRMAVSLQACKDFCQ